MGYKTCYTADMPETIIRLMKEGASKTEVAAELGIARITFYKWLDNIGIPAEHYETFKDAVSLGETYSQAWWEKAGRLGITSGNIDGSLWFKNMKNRFHWDWKERNETTLKGDSENPLNFGGPITIELVSGKPE